MAARVDVLEPAGVVEDEMRMRIRIRTRIRTRMRIRMRMPWHLR